MKRRIIVGVAIAGLVLTATIFGAALYVYYSIRSIDQTLATNVQVTSEWTEIKTDPPLTAIGQIQEVGFTIPDHKRDQANEDLPEGQIRLPNGKIATPTVEAYDAAGNLYEMPHSGFSFSMKVLTVFTADQKLGQDVRITKIRIRSYEPFVCEEIIWRNRDLK